MCPHGGSDWRADDTRAPGHTEDCCARGPRAPEHWASQKGTQRSQPSAGNVGGKPGWPSADQKALPVLYMCYEHWARTLTRHTPRSGAPRACGKGNKVAPRNTDVLRVRGTLPHHWYSAHPPSLLFSLRLLVLSHAGPVWRLPPRTALWELLNQS